jgi:hypothetical protein
MSIPSGKILFIGDLGSECTDSDLAEWFSDFGSVQHTRVHKYRPNKVSMGYGLVKMSSTEEAERASLNLEGRLLFGRKLRIRFVGGDIVGTKQWFLKPRMDSLYVKFEALEVGKSVNEQTIRSIFSHFGDVVDASVSRSLLDKVSDTHVFYLLNV